MGQQHPDTAQLALSHAGLRFWLTAAIITSLIIGILGTVIPMRIGLKAFRTMEL
jgi:ABC-2 type transport system permease protein